MRQGGLGQSPLAEGLIVGRTPGEAPRARTPDGDQGNSTHQRTQAQHSTAHNSWVGTDVSIWAVLTGSEPTVFSCTTVKPPTTRQYLSEFVKHVSDL